MSLVEQSAPYAVPKIKTDVVLLRGKSSFEGLNPKILFSHNLELLDGCFGLPQLSLYSMEFGFGCFGVRGSTHFHQLVSHKIGIWQHVI